MSLESTLAGIAVDVGAAVVKKLLAGASDDEVTDTFREELAGLRHAQKLHDERAIAHFGGSVKL